jgi:hypothetical protein
MNWFMMRGIHITDFVVNPKYCSEVSDDSVELAGTSNLGRASIDNAITDVAALALGQGCGQLMSIDLNDCGVITDVGVSALGYGCDQLQ